MSKKVYVPRGKASRPEALKRYDGSPRISLDEYLRARKKRKS